jgi:hypothetical protein
MTYAVPWPVVPVVACALLLELLLVKTVTAVDNISNLLSIKRYSRSTSIRNMPKRNLSITSKNEAGVEWKFYRKMNHRRIIYSTCFLIVFIECTHAHSQCLSLFFLFRDMILKHFNNYS